MPSWTINARLSLKIQDSEEENLQNLQRSKSTILPLSCASNCNVTIPLDSPTGLRAQLVTDEYFRNSREVRPPRRVPLPILAESERRLHNPWTTLSMNCPSMLPLPCFATTGPTNLDASTAGSGSFSRACSSARYIYSARTLLETDWLVPRSSCLLSSENRALS